MKLFKKTAIMLLLSIVLVVSIASFVACGGDDDNPAYTAPDLATQGVFQNASMRVINLQSGIITSASTQQLAIFEDDTFLLTTVSNTYVAGSNNFDVAGYPFNPYSNNYRQIFGVFETVEENSDSVKIKLLEVTRVIISERSLTGGEPVVGDTATSEGAKADNLWRRAIINPETVVTLNKASGEMENISVTTRNPLDENAGWPALPDGAVIPLGTFQATSLTTQELSQGIWTTEHKNQRLTLFNNGEYMLSETIAIFSADRDEVQTMGYNFTLESSNIRTIFGKYSVTVDMPEINLLAVLLDSTDRIVISDRRGSALVGDTATADDSLKQTLMSKVQISATEPIELDTSNTRIGSGGGGTFIVTTP